MRNCKFCHQDIPYGKRKSHECDEYYDYLDQQEAKRRQELDDQANAREAILSDEFSHEQAKAIIRLIEYMAGEE